MKSILLTSVLVPFGLAIGAGCAVDDGPVQTTAMVNGTAGDTGAGGDDTGAGGDTTGSSGGGVGGKNEGGGAGKNEGGGGIANAGGGGAANGGGGVAAGGGGMGGSGGSVEIGSGKSDYGYMWKDSWWISGCQTKAGHDCITINNCPNGGAANFEDRGAVTKETFPIGGAMGTTYAVTFQINGISEGKFYTAGTRDAGNNTPANINSADLDTFHQDGTAVVSNYNVIKLTVLDSTGKEVRHYYFNSFPQASGAESHRTFHLSYTKTIDVPGGGSVVYLNQDSNCHAIDNCGDGDVSDTVCNAARGIPHEEAAPLPAMGIDPNPANDVQGKHRAVALGTLNSVNGSTKPWHSQIIHLTITKAVAK